MQPSLNACAISLHDLSVTSVDWDPIADSQAEVVLGTPAVATIMILDDDHSGIFHFESEKAGASYLRLSHLSLSMTLAMSE